MTTPTDLVQRPSQAAFPATEYEQRLQRTRDGMRTHGVDCLVVQSTPNAAWLTGYEAAALYEEFRKILNHIGLARHHVLHVDAVQRDALCDGALPQHPIRLDNHHLTGTIGVARTVKEPAGLDHERFWFRLRCLQG